MPANEISKCLLSQPTIHLFRAGNHFKDDGLHLQCYQIKSRGLQGTSPGKVQFMTPSRVF